MPAYGALNSSFTVNGVVHDPLTGLDTGSGNDRITTGLGEDNFTTGAGGDSFNCDDILLGHGVTGFSTENLDSRLINHDDFLLVNNVGGVPQGPGGTSYLTGYAEAVGLDSSVFHSPINNLGGSAGPGGDDI